MAYVSLGSSSDPLASVRAGTSVLKRGQKGDLVRALQTLLQGAVNNALVVDGDFGPSTENVVKSVQTANKLSVDGVVGKQTMQVLDAIAADVLPGRATAALDLTKRTPAAPRTKAEAIAAAKAAAKAKIAAQVLDMRQKGINDAETRKYAPPAPTAPPDFNTMNYQAGWLSTGVALPPGVVRIGDGGRPVATAAGGDAAGGGAGAGDNKMLIAGGVLAAAAVAAVVLMRGRRRTA
jgi:peptidoglycan hydrolase-like protein with peptidoglycan-binding domain